MPDHLTTHQFFLNLHHILNDDGCLLTNSNFPSTTAFNRLLDGLCTTFESNILLAHTNTIENARIIISGSQSCLTSISSQDEAIRQAEQLEKNARFEFSLSRLISHAYRGLITNNTKNNCSVFKI